MTIPDMNKQEFTFKELAVWSWIGKIKSHLQLYPLVQISSYLLNFAMKMGTNPAIFRPSIRLTTHEN